MAIRLLSCGVVFDLLVGSRLGSSCKFLWLLFLFLLEIPIILFSFYCVLAWKHALSLVLHILHKLLHACVGQDIIWLVIVCPSPDHKYRLPVFGCTSYFLSCPSDTHFPLDMGRSKIFAYVLNIHIFTYFSKTWFKVP